MVTGMGFVVTHHCILLPSSDPKFTLVFPKFELFFPPCVISEPVFYMTFAVIYTLFHAGKDKLCPWSPSDGTKKTKPDAFYFLPPLL